MRIVHIIPSVEKESSGPSYSVVNLCKGLIKKGFETELAALRWSSTSTYNFSFLKTFKMGWMPQRLGQSSELFEWIKTGVNSGRVDILHNHGMWQMNSLYPGWVSRKSNVIFISSPRGTFSKWAMQNGSLAKLPFWFFLQKPLLNRVDCFHATSESEYLDIRRLGFSQPVAIIPNGINIPRLPKKKKKNLKTLLFLGRIHPVKGLDILLPAWRAVQPHFPDWQLIIAGSDDDYYGRSGYLKEMHVLSDDLKLERVKFVGELHGPDKMQLYSDADLFVLPSYSENFGVVVAEALSSGVPVITTTSTPWKDIQAYQAGWCVNANVESLVKCMLDALQLPNIELNKMGDNGRKWMKDEFSWDCVVKKMSDTYEWLYSKSKVSPNWVKVD